MRIYIPTYRRTHRQRTWQFLNDYWRARTTFVVDKEDYRIMGEDSKYGKADFDVVPLTVKTIAQKRAWILKTTPHARILMLDDDLRFCVRTYCCLEHVGQHSLACPRTLPNATPKQVDKALVRMSALLGRYAHAGFGARQGNNTLPDFGVRKNARMIYALGYQPKIVRKVCELGRIETREDMDYALQLLRAGYENVVDVEMVVDQFYNAKGGAREERTVERSNKDAEKLAKLHPGLVKVVERDYKQSLPRKEVVVQWRKAFNHG